jgi:hypothetical protein
MSWHEALIFVGGLAVGLIPLFWSSYIGKRGEKSGEIDAVQAKIDLVLWQQKATTKVTEDIKAIIADRVFSKEKRYEDMRTTAVEIMKSYGTLLRASSELFAAKGLANVSEVTGTQELKKQASEKWDLAYQKFSDAMTTFWQLEEIAKLFFPERIWAKMENTKNAFNKLVTETYENNLRFNPLYEELKVKQLELSSALRTELDSLLNADSSTEK